MLSVLFTFPLNTPGSDPLVRQLYEFEEQIEDPTSMLTPMSRSLWKYRRQVTVEHLGNSFQQEAQSTAVNQHKVLGTFLKQVTLREVYMAENIFGRPTMLPLIHNGISQSLTVTQIYVIPVSNMLPTTGFLLQIYRQCV